MSVQRTDGANSDISTADTIKQMIQIVHDNSKHPLVVDRVQGILLTSGASTKSKLIALYEATKQNIKFRNDEDLLGELLGLPPDKELLFTPHFVLTNDNVSGDCDDYSTLLATMIVAEGLDVDTYFVTICADPNEPNRWSHVYVAVKDSEGTMIPMDASHGPYVGWETTKAIKKKYWLVNEGRKKEMVLHSGVRGVGDFWGDFAAASNSGDYSNPGSNSIDWTSILAPTVSQGMNILKSVVTAPQPGQYYSTDAKGNTIAYALPTGATSLTAGMFPTSTGSSTMLLLIGAAVLAVIAFSKG